MGTETTKPIINDQTYRLNFTNEGGAEKTNRLLRELAIRVTVRAGAHEGMDREGLAGKL